MREIHVYVKYSTKCTGNSHCSYCDTDTAKNASDGRWIISNRAIYLRTALHRHLNIFQVRLAQQTDDGEELYEQTFSEFSFPFSTTSSDLGLIILLGIQQLLCGLMFQKAVKCWYKTSIKQLAHPVSLLTVKAVQSI